MSDKYKINVKDMDDKEFIEFLRERHSDDLLEHQYNSLSQKFKDKCVRKND